MGDGPGFRTFGEEEMVVTVVVAVRGRSPEPFETVCPDVAGSFPVNSSFFIRDLSSSSSSQTVDGGAVFEFAESVPSGIDGFTPFGETSVGDLLSDSISGSLIGDRPSREDRYCGCRWLELCIEFVMEDLLLL